MAAAANPSNDSIKEPPPPPFVCTFVDTKTGEKIKATEELMRHCGMIRDWKKAEMVGEKQPEMPMVPNEQFYFKHLRVLIDYLELKRQRDPAGSEPNFDIKGPQVNVPEWSTAFFKQVEERDMDELVGASNLSDFLMCPSFMRDVCAYVARRTDNMTVTQLRAYFRIENDYTKEEWAAFREDPDFREVMEADGILNDK